jgi:hypothetical protein
MYITGHFKEYFKDASFFLAPKPLLIVTEKRCPPDNLGVKKGIGYLEAQLYI